MRDHPVDNVRGILGRIDDEIEHASGQASLVKGFRDQRMGARTGLGGAEQHRVAASDRIGNRARGQQDRPIPRHNAQHHANRLTQRHRKRARLIGGDSGALNLGGEAGSLAQQRRRAHHVEGCPQGRGANLLGHGDEDGVLLGLQPIGGGQQDRAPFIRAGLGPGFKGIMRGIHRTQRVIDAGGSSARDRLARHGIEPFEHATVFRVNLLVIDHQANIHLLFSIAERSSRPFLWPRERRLSESAFSTGRRCR